MKEASVIEKDGEFYSFKPANPTPCRDESVNIFVTKGYTTSGDFDFSVSAPFKYDKISNAIENHLAVYMAVSLSYDTGNGGSYDLNLEGYVFPVDNMGAEEVYFTIEGPAYDYNWEDQEDEEKNPKYIKATVKAEYEDTDNLSWSVVDIRVDDIHKKSVRCGYLYNLLISADSKREPLSRYCVDELEYLINNKENIRVKGELDLEDGEEGEFDVEYSYMYGDSTSAYYKHEFATILHTATHILRIKKTASSYYSFQSYIEIKRKQDSVFKITSKGSMVGPMFEPSSGDIGMVDFVELYDNMFDNKTIDDIDLNLEIENESSSVRPFFLKPRFTSAYINDDNDYVFMFTSAWNGSNIVVEIKYDRNQDITYVEFK